MKALSGVFVLCILLASCGESKEDDLDRFMRNAGNDMRSRVKPLPEVQAFTPLLFNPENSLNNPFMPRKVIAVNSGGKKPDLDRPREVLEFFPLADLKFVGLLQKGKTRYALIKAPDNSLHQVVLGNHLGQDLGMVVELTDSEVKIKESVQDDLSGKWIERDASINLQE